MCPAGHEHRVFLPEQRAAYYGIKWREKRDAKQAEKSRPGRPITPSGLVPRVALNARVYIPAASPRERGLFPAGSHLPSLRFLCSCGLGMLRKSLFFCLILSRIDASLSLSLAGESYMAEGIEKGAERERTIVTRLGTGGGVAPVHKMKLSCRDSMRTFVINSFARFRRRGRSTTYMFTQFFFLVFYHRVMRGDLVSYGRVRCLCYLKMISPRYT